jgi:hypothetical protein
MKYCNLCCAFVIESWIETATEGSRKSPEDIEKPLYQAHIGGLVLFFFLHNQTINMLIFFMLRFSGVKWATPGMQTMTKPVAVPGIRSS